ncbi:MAG: hypothetical protein A2163_03190 [Actinobacteria bacterium RBG_13_35_12]|nr:MAG: hypothetical protein A2163_03190 [Actinobacteria bacterium RBG_13_35_12]
MIEIINITKKYGAIVALNNVNITFKKGEIHGLVGKNGAGKSTLIDILYGRISPTSGKIYINSTEIDFRRYHPDIAHQKMKIAIVPQQTEYAQDLTLEENIFLGFEKVDNLGNLDRKYMKNKTREILKEIGLDNYSPETKLVELSFAEKQLLNIGQTLYLRDSEIILLDEIASGLSEERMHFISEQLKKERKKNKTIIYVSHRLKEVIGLCDRITVLRNGSCITTEDIQEMNLDKLTRYIIGSDINMQNSSDAYYLKDYSTQPLLEIKNLSLDHSLKNINFKIYKGEVFGIAGLGVKKLMEILSGIILPSQGEIIYKGEKVFFTDPNTAIKRGIAYLSDDREGESIFTDFSIKDNSIVGSWEKISNFWGINSQKEFELFFSFTKQLRLSYNKFSDNITTLSGGNRQKVCVGRLINMFPSVFILNEPTKGIDVQVKYELMQYIREKLTKNSAIIMSSPEDEELLMVADRILVLYNGKVYDVIPRSEFSESRIFKAVQGG